MFTVADPLLLLGFAILALGFFWLAGMAVGLLVRFQRLRRPLKAVGGLLLVAYLVLAVNAAVRVVQHFTYRELDGIGSEDYLAHDGDGVTVARVIDGDTIELSTGDKVRIVGINTPETVDPRRGVECFGPEASARAKELLEGAAVTLTPDGTQDSVDRYGRLLRYVELIDGTDVGLQLIEEGFAFEYTYDKPYARQAVYIAAEATAKSNETGIWSDVCQK